MRHKLRERCLVRIGIYQFLSEFYIIIIEVPTYQQFVGYTIIYGRVSHVAEIVMYDIAVDQ